MITKKQEKKKKPSLWYLLRDSNGKKSLSYTMVVWAFFAVLSWMVVSIAEEPLGIKIREFSGSESALFLSPIYALYFGRKHTKTKAGENTEEESTETEAPTDSTNT